MFKHFGKILGVTVAALALTALPFAGSKASANDGFIHLCMNQTLRYGSRGDCVKMLQNLMDQARVMTIGWGNNPGWPWATPVDGIFGSDTKQAVTAYQFTKKAQGANIRVDGIAGPQTWTYLHGDCFGNWVSRGFRSQYCAGTNW